MRAIIRCRDDHYLHPVPPLDITGCRVLHLDGHQADAAIHYAKACREAGIMTSLDGGGMRANTRELLEFTDVAVVSKRLCEQLQLSPKGMCEMLKAKGCRIGGVTLGEDGMLWYDETGELRLMPALKVPPAGWWTPMAPATSSTEPTSTPTWSRRSSPGSGTSALRGRHPPIRSAFWGSKRRCRRAPTSRRLSAAIDRPPERDPSPGDQRARFASITLFDLRTLATSGSARSSLRMPLAAIAIGGPAMT